MKSNLKPQREAPTPVKLGDLRARADRAAERMRTNRSALIRLALLCKLEEIERGYLKLPVGAGQ